MSGRLPGPDGPCLVRYDARDDVAFLTLDHPPLNILTAAMMDQVTAALERAQADPSLKAVCLTAGGKVFSAGADIGEHRPEQAAAMIAAFSRMFSGLGRLELPLVMVVDGAALGAGFELVMMADVLLAGERATFAQPEVRLGFFAPLAVAWLPQRLGLARAVEVTCTGRSYTAAEMQTLGLVTRVVPSERLPACLEEVLADLRRASPLVLRMNVRLLRRLYREPFENGRREAERVFLEELMRTEDVREGIAAFSEKRAPVWTNR